MPRLLVLFRRPYHLSAREARSWLLRELEDVLRRDGLRLAALSPLGLSEAPHANSYDWLLELCLATGTVDRALEAGGACGELIADLKLLGMAPVAVVVDDGNRIDLRPR